MGPDSAAMRNQPKQALRAGPSHLADPNDRSPGASRLMSPRHRAGNRRRDDRATPAPVTPLRGGGKPDLIARKDIRSLYATKPAGDALGIAPGPCGAVRLIRRRSAGSSAIGKGHDRPQRAWPRCSGPEAHYALPTVAARSVPVAEPLDFQSAAEQFRRGIPLPARGMPLLYRRLVDRPSRVYTDGLLEPSQPSVRGPADVKSAEGVPRYQQPPRLGNNPAAARTRR